MYMKFILKAANKMLMFIVVTIGKKRCDTIGWNMNRMFTPFFASSLSS